MSANNKFIDFLSSSTVDEELDLESSEEEDSSKLTESEKAINIPLNGSPLYPRIFWGDSAKSLSTGPFPESEVGDDNITNTWHGLMSFYG